MIKKMIEHKIVVLACVCLCVCKRTYVHGYCFFLPTECLRYKQQNSPQSMRER